jgi:cyclin-dependent kinase 8/11
MICGRNNRAPELLFGTRCYDANATDLWSLGATLAEFMTPLRLSDPDGEEDELDLEGERENARPFITPDVSHMMIPNLRSSRDPLFDASRGEIGLAWSIFKIRGMPTDENCPVRARFPHFWLLKLECP